MVNIVLDTNCLMSRKANALIASDTDKDDNKFVDCAIISSFL